MDSNKQWNAAIDLLQEILMDNNEGRYRAAIRDNQCCKEVAEIKKLMICYLKDLKQ